jgi:RNA polymerase sigma-70 factor (ECF subfamily)
MQESKHSRASKRWERHADHDERTLLQRVRADDHDAFEALFARYVTTVYRQAVRLTGNRPEAEEVVQEVFLTVYEKVQTFRGQSAFSTWLYRVTVNAALTKLRRRKGHVEVGLEQFLPRVREDGHHLVQPVSGWSNELEARVDSAELQRLLQEAIEQLPPVNRAVVVLSDLEGLSDREISAALGLTVSAVKSRLHRGRLFLRGKLVVALRYL